MSRLVVDKSRLELARVLLADQYPNVVAITVQPFQLAGPTRAITAAAIRRIPVKIDVDLGSRT